VLVAPDPASLSGHGPAVAAALVTLWNTGRTHHRKIVWAEYDLSDRRTH
jgi:hypothetical protein